MTDSKQQQTDPLLRPTCVAVVDDLERAGLFSGAAARMARQQALPERHWLVWADRLLFGLGLALILAGIACFVAANWQNMTGLTKIGLAAFGVAGSSIGSAWAPKDSLVRHGLLIAACAFVGVLFLVIGQVYQTGADAWELFALWAVLMSGYVIAMPSAPILTFHLAVLDTAYILYYEQVADPAGADWPIFWVGLFLLQLGFYWSAFRIQHTHWYKQLLTVACLALMVTPVCFGIGLWPDASGPIVDYLGPIIACALGLPLGWKFFLRQRDIGAFALVVFAVESVLLTGIGRCMLEIPLLGYQIFLFGIVLVLATGKSVAIIRQQHKRMEGV